MSYIIKKTSLFCCCSLFGLSVFAQQPAIDIDQFVDDLFALQDDDLLYEDLYESLYQLYTNPIDINEASFEELSSLYTLTPAQIEDLLQYRRLNGAFLSIYELQSVPSLDMASIRRILPFISIVGDGSDPRTLLQRIASEKNNYLILRTERALQLPAGFLETDTVSGKTKYAGSPFKQYARFRVSHTRDFSFGFTMEKDAGEQLNWNRKERQYGFDYYSFHAELKNAGRWKSVNLGDYQLQMGQGLVFGSGYGVGKGGETILTAKRNTLGLRPYTSVLETGFFRGAAASYSVGKWELTLLSSRLRQDATLQTDSLAGEQPFSFVSSILNTGLHRTSSEVAARNKVTELNTGGTVVYKTALFQAGINTLFTRFSSPIEKRPALYNQFEFSGRQNFVGSLHFSKSWQNAQFFGEAARSSSGGTGTVGGMLLSLSNKIGISLVGRSYDRNFHSFYARAFGEASRNINEKGIYWGFKWHIAKRLTFTAYYDHFMFPWLRINADAPTDGFEYMGMATFKASKATRLYGQYRRQVKGVNGDLSQFNVRVPVDGRKTNYIINLDHDPGGLLSFKSRVQLSNYQQENEISHGYALVQDVNLKWNRIKIGSRIAVFDADDSNNRQYVYEKDVLYSFSIPSYAGTGVRSYILLQYRISSKIDLWLRWSKFAYNETESTGTGLQKVEGSRKADIKFQLLLSLF